jgi:CRISPR system Cascade subunit CasD
MSTLLMRLAGPMQSWGLDKFERRGTARMPTKSAVVGMLAAAMGRGRQESVEDLMALKFAVRMDNGGVVIRDFHTAKEKGKRDSYITNRYYLCDAIFLVGLEGDDDLLEELEQALKTPVFPLFMGRRSCPPEGRISLGIKRKPLVEAMREEPWLLSPWRQERYWRFHDSVSLALVVDADMNDQHYYHISDNAVSFDPTRRLYAQRRVSEQRSIVFNAPKAPNEALTRHDAIAELKGGA